MSNNFFGDEESDMEEFTVAPSHTDSKKDVTDFPWATLSLSVMTQLINSIVMTSLAPFLSLGAMDRGSSILGIGLIYSAFQFGQLLVAWPSKRLIPILGILPLIQVGLLGASIGNFLLGFYGHYDGSIYLQGSIISRFFAGTSFGLAVMGVKTNVFLNSPVEHRGTVIGAMVGASGMGMIMGPMFGGLLYAFGEKFYESGYITAFYGNGVLLMVYVFSTCWFENVHCKVETTERKFNTIEALTQPSIFYPLIMKFMGSVSFAGFLDPNLGVHFNRKYDLSPTQIATCFASCCIIYATTAPCVGWATSKIGNIQIMMLGSAAVGIWYLGVGPSPFISSYVDHTFVEFLTIYTIGGPFALSTVPVENYLQNQVEIAFGEKHADSVAAMAITSLMLGCIIGPNIMGTIVYFFGYPVAGTFLSSMYLLLGGGAFICYRMGILYDDYHFVKSYKINKPKPPIHRRISTAASMCFERYAEPPIQNLRFSRSPR